MKNRGYIYIITLMIISLLAIFFYFIYSFVENSTYLNFNRVEKINSKYAAESVLNMAVSDKDFKKKLEEIVFNNKYTINLKTNINLQDTDIKKLNIVNKSSGKKDLVEIDTNIKFKNSLAAAKIRANIINKIYKEEDGILNSSKLESEELIEVKEGFNKHNFQSSNKEFIELDGDFIIDYIAGTRAILEEVEEYDEELDEFVKREVEVRKFENKDIIYQKSGTLELRNRAKISFLIINDKVVFNDNKLFGIIVINEGAEISNNCMLEGYLIDLYDKNSSINVNYDYLMVKSFGDVLPEYVKFQPISLNHYDLEN
ncbi:hypothetical protein KQI68_04935 [Peptoniphilus sp. MSJ-1]|uniref:Uncharacterized protein n=1 Tax=Peptoniphilus ovalis TaxID=2841503 RepID=A0ABS6FG81_9FIRM|nr:hypothetical protein [Peptoniphilus ovalis]MBU5669186.1 hypothetical protein [Peptoniphilus ovalis]